MLIRKTVFLCSFLIFALLYSPCLQAEDPSSDTALEGDQTEEEETVTVTTYNGETIECDVADMGLNDDDYTKDYWENTKELDSPDAVGQTGIILVSDIGDLQRIQEITRGEEELSSLRERMASLESDLDQRMEVLGSSGASGYHTGGENLGCGNASNPVACNDHGNGSVYGGCWDTGIHATTPIVLDMNGNNEPDLYDGNWMADKEFSTKNCVVFDIDGDGKKEVVEWMYPNQDGLLVVDKSSDGWIMGQRELFGSAEGFSNGYRKLAALFDKNKDNQISGEELKPLSVWIDNGDGKSNSEELYTLEELGITHINCHAPKLHSLFTIGGSDRKTWDWFTEYIE